MPRASREWLVADGLGGYAMGTVAGLRTRRYHGLLVVAGEHFGARSVGLAELDTVVVIGDRRVALSCHEWAGGVVDPNGHHLLERFELVDGLPRWRWNLGNVVIERELALTHGRALSAVVHKVIRADGPVRIELTPLCTWRDAHGDRFAYGEPAVTPTSDGFVFEDRFRLAGPDWQPGGEWYRGAWLRAEADRGLGAAEDLWASGRFVTVLEPGEQCGIVAAAAPFDGRLPDAATVIGERSARARSVVATVHASGDHDATLALAADQFIVSTPTGPSGPTVVAGYPWFGEWSRDTMTSYEGLLLETRRYDEGRALLLRAAQTLSEGMLANTADAGGLEYNTADGTLWFVHALGRHVAVTGDTDLAASVYADVEGIFDWHMLGTRFGIGVDPGDGLLRQGADGLALTWMDARVDGRPITGRAGKAVEVNALWISALGTAVELASHVGQDPSRWAAMTADATGAFARRFPRPDGYGLHDVVDGPGGDDASVRPNQLFALSLPHGPGGPRSIVDVCRTELLTSLGLRSLAPSDPAYRGRHRGGPAERDGAYHQGTVWPWLIGPYVEADLKKVTAASAPGRPGGSVASQSSSAELVPGLLDHLGEWGLGSVSETADGDAPHRATGCPFQAWSVAETIRAKALLDRGPPPPPSAVQ